jgi:hypothetical protein
MAIQVYYVYEPQVTVRGWPDDSWLALPSWFDKDLAEPTAEPPFFVNVNLVFAPLVQYQSFPPFVTNPNTIFPPRAFTVGETNFVLKNEVRRIMTLRRKPPPEK